MRILRLTATFGNLNGQTIELSPGLNVIQAPNEGGKSTWAAFLRAMLYGVDTKERGPLADKNRYLPWSGSPMGGEMELEWQGRQIILRRYANQSGPFGGFEAVYAATGDPVSGLTAADAGELLTGVKKDVFVRTAFVLQGSSAPGSSQDLETRVTNLATGGQEDISFTAAEKTLRDWRNRRKSNRSNGMIPLMENELIHTGEALAATAELRKQRREGRKNLLQLDREEAFLREKLEQWDQIEQQDLNLKYDVAVAEWKKAQADCGPQEPHPIFGTLSGEEAWNLALERKDARERILEENRVIGEHREAAKQRLNGGKLCNYIAISFVAFAVILLVAGLVAQNVVPLAAPITVALLLAALFALQGTTRIREGRKVLIGEKLQDVPEDEDIMSQAAAYREMLVRRERAQETEVAARRRVEELYAQGAREQPSDASIPVPENARGEIMSRLEDLDKERQQWKQYVSRAEGAMEQMGEPADLEARQEELRALLHKRTEEYNAIGIALDALDAANTSLRERFSPILNREAGAIVKELTGGRWQRMELDRTFSARTAEQGSIMMRSAEVLSTGTMDQVYLSLRLALCKLIVPDAPIILDDALCTFDDARMARAMEYLLRMGEERQVLVFSCHSREANWAQNHGLEAERLSGRHPPR